MYKANLSHKQLEKYLDILMETNLLRIEDNLYIITEKGKEFIKQFRELLKILGEERVDWVQINTF
jgi:predicted transcriptional regulator